MTVEEISRRAKEKFIKAKKEFKNGDFFKVVKKDKIFAIGCLKSIDSDSYTVEIEYHFIYNFVHNGIEMDVTLVVDFDVFDLIKASPQEAIFIVNKLKNNGKYYDRRTRKVKLIEKLF